MMRLWKLQLYTPHAMQLKIHRSTKRFRVAAFGRQAGKSTGALNDMVSRAWSNRGQNFWYLMPTYDGCLVQYRRLKRMMEPSGAAVRRTSDTELSMEFINRSTITFKSGKILENLRTETLHGACLDEVRQLHPDLWPMVIQPMLGTTGGWALFISTPNGFDQFYDLAETAKVDPEWDYFQAPSTCNPLFPKEEAERLRRTMTEGQFRQEIMAEFLDIQAGRAYPNYSQEWNDAEKNPFARDGGLVSPHMPIVVGLDFNLNPMSWELGQFRQGVKQWYWFDEISLDVSGPNEGTPAAAIELAHRLHGYANRQGIVLCGDATSKSRQRAAASQSDYDVLLEVLRDQNINYVNATPKSNPFVKDRVTTVNSYLRSAAGLTRMWLHPERCKALKTDFQRVTWKEGAQFVLDQTKKDKDGKTLTHPSDAIGYPVCELSPMDGVQDVGSLRVIRRR